MPDPEDPATWPWDPEGGERHQSFMCYVEDLLLTPGQGRDEDKRLAVIRERREQGRAPRFGFEQGAG